MTTLHVADATEEARVRASVAASVVRTALAHYPRKTDAVRAIAKLGNYVARFERLVGPAKLVRVGEAWKLQPMTPAWPSPAFDQWARRRLEVEVPIGAERPMISAGLVAVTARCPLHCVFCSADRELAHHDRLELPVLQRIVRELQAARVSLIWLTGGEPMVRLDDVIRLVAEADRVSEFWINTSGIGLDARAARRLADAGLTGAWISLDSDDPAEHERLRGWPGAFEMARSAAQAANGAGLMVGLSLVATRELVDRVGALEAYAALAASWGVYAIRVQTPRAVGRWAGQDVELSDAQVARVGAWTDATNGGPLKAERPAVLFDEIFARRLGCKQGGVLSVYVDSFGDVHGCPFCLNAGGSLLEGTLEDALIRLRSRGCTRFHPEVA